MQSHVPCTHSTNSELLSSSSFPVSKREINLFQVLALICANPHHKPLSNHFLKNVYLICFGLLDL